MTTKDDTNRLVSRLAVGDSSALNALLSKYRPRLNYMVRNRLDHRLTQRVDPSDVVQDVLTQAAKQADQFLASPTAMFYPWLRKIAVNRMIDLRRTHIEAQRRSVCREERGIGSLSSDGQTALAKTLVTLQASPSEQIITEERRERVRSVLRQLKKIDREVLAMRFLEQLSSMEAAAALDISENTFAQRLVRALRRVKRLLDIEEGTAS